MTKVEIIDENTVSFCRETYVKMNPPQKLVSDKDPEFWDLIDSIDNGDAIIFESDTYYKN